MERTTGETTDQVRKRLLAQLELPLTEAEIERIKIKLRVLDGESE